MADETSHTETPAADAAPARERKERSPRTVEDRALLKAMGKAIWRAESGTGATVAEKNAAWSEGRRKYMSRAGALLKAFRREGIEISAAAGSTDAGGEEA